MNAFVLYKLHDDVTHKKLPKGYSSLDFIDEWMREVCEGEQDAHDDASASSSSESESDGECVYKEHRRKWWEGKKGTAIRMDRQFHGLEHAGHVYRKGAIVGGEEKRFDLRRSCFCCGERTLYFCDVCKVPLCIGSCNKVFHTERDLPSMK